ncbi:MAG: flagellar hook protein FlgE [Actinomycetota bacterium]
MLRSLFSGISGLRSHQTMMDVTGNNIANVNTAGYKTSQTVFQDTLSQMLKAAGAPQGVNGGTNPAQVGLGSRLGSINMNFSQGAAQTTGRNTDLMVQGDGFFVVRNGGEDLYTRAGAFSFDSDGRLVTQDGAVVQGWTAVRGVVNTNATPGDLRLPIGTLLPPTATAASTVGGNLPGDAAVGTVVTSSITTYDPQGAQHPVSYRFSKTAADTWSLTMSENGTTLGTATLTFDAGGKLTSAPTVTYPASYGGTVTVDLTGVTQYAGSSTVAVLSQDGSAMGSLQAFTISPDGTLVGVFSNGLKQTLGQVALATFNNPPGLERVGGSDYRTTVNSGTAQLGVAGSGGRGTLLAGALEMSNVDLAQEFTNLIVAQRGFQANSRVITTSDQLLQDLVNLKR